MPEWMTYSNLQRETILPSERAWAYRMKLEAMKHQGSRSDLTSSQFETKLRSDEKMANDSGQSRATVQRFVHLTYLIPELLEMLDQKQLAFNPAVELSYLTKEQQTGFLEAMEYAQTTPSLSQAQRLKRLAADGMTMKSTYRKVKQMKVTMKSN